MVGWVMEQHHSHITYLDVSGLLGDVVVITASGHHLIRNGLHFILHFIDGLHFGWIANAEGGNYSRRLSTGYYVAS